MKRQLLLKLGLVAVLGAGVFVAYLWWKAPKFRIDEEGYRAIRIGMRFDDVVVLLGPPRYLPGQVEELPCGSLRSMAIEREGYVWQSDKMRILVRFDTQHLATGAMMYGGSFPESFLTKLRGWLRLK